MLKPNENRLDYGDILLSPANYHLDSLIGTTYSLDLETLTALSIALGLDENTDSKLCEVPIYMLNALHKVSDKILIFCDAGHISIPSKQSALFLILEKMIVNVALESKKGNNSYPSFHPKMWLATYVSDYDNNKKYKLVVMSRNLTDDRNWDVCVSMDGELSQEEQEKSKPLESFLKFLRKQIKPSFQTSKSKIKLIDEVLKDVSKIKFNVLSKKFIDFEVLPLGIGNGSYDMNNDPLFKDKYDDLFVMSPFLSDAAMYKLNSNARSNKSNSILITRKESLSQIKYKESLSNFKIYTLIDAMIDGESIISEENEEFHKQDIHAKIYMRRCYSDVSLYLGSMNASNSAINRNVELMIKLYAKNRYLNIDTLSKDILGDTNSPFEETVYCDEQSVLTNNVQNELENRIRMFVRLNATADTIKKDNGLYDLVVNVEENDLIGIKIAPLRVESKMNELSNSMRFENLNELELSEFYIIRATDKDEELTRVIMIPTNNLPVDRDKAVVKSIVKDRKTFMDYVSFTLDDNYLMASFETQNSREHGLDHTNAESLPAIYEKMLKMTSMKTSKIDELDYIINMVDDNEIIPDEFRKMYHVFKNVLKKVK